ncbi:MAG: hypothetical protein ACR2P4_02210 [Gammaproteobacteria bacterium]
MAVILMPDGGIKTLFHKALGAALETLRAKDKYGWLDGEFAKIRQLQADNRGAVGEDFVVALLTAAGKKVKHTARTDPQNKQWDIVADGIRLEVKLATMGASSATFQHEHLEKDRQYDGIIFVDVAPDDIYIICVAKCDIDWSKLHRRRHGIEYKWDWTLSKIRGNKMTTLADFIAAYDKMARRITSAKGYRRPPEEI